MSENKDQPLKITEAIKVSKDDAKDSYESLDAMRRTAGWRLYSAALIEQQKERVKVVLQPATGMDDAFLRQYTSGAAWAFGSAADDFLSFLLEYYKSLVEDLTEAEAIAEAEQKPKGE